MSQQVVEAIEATTRLTEFIGGVSEIPTFVSMVVMAGLILAGYLFKWAIRKMELRQEFRLKNIELGDQLREEQRSEIETLKAQIADCKARFLAAQRSLLAERRQKMHFIRQNQILKRHLEIALKGEESKENS